MKYYEVETTLKYQLELDPDDEEQSLEEQVNSFLLDKLCNDSGSMLKQLMSNLTIKEENNG